MISETEGSGLLDEELPGGGCPLSQAMKKVEGQV